MSIPGDITTVRQLQITQNSGAKSRTLGKDFYCHVYRESIWANKPNARKYKQIETKSMKLCTISVFLKITLLSILLTEMRQTATGFCTQASYGRCLTALAVNIEGTVPAVKET